MAPDRPRLRIKPFPEGAPAHLLAYVGGDRSLEGLYHRWPLPPSFLPGADAAEGAPLDGATASSIRQLNLAGGATGESADKLDRLEEGGTLFVLAGQQPCLLLGPSFALYKLLSIIDLARRASDATGRPVIPLFWIASHDSDRDEIDHIRLPGPHGEPTGLRYPFDETMRGEQVGGMTIEKEKWRAWIGEVREALPPSSFREEVIDALLPLADDRPTVTGLFARTVHVLLPGSGTVLFDGRAAEVDPRGMAVMANTILHGADTLEALRAGARLLADRSIPPPLPTDPGRLPLYLVRDGVRIPLRMEGDEITAGESFREKASRFARRIAAGEARVTPAAALRPVVQDAVFPTAATVAGHSELVYHAQIGPLYELLGTRRPPLVPRASLFLLHFRTAEKLDRAGIAPADLAPTGTARVGATVLSPSIERFRETIAGALADVLDALDRDAPGAVPADDPVRTRLLRETDRAAERLASLADRATENRRNLVHRAANELFPGGRAQEHVTSPLFFLARYGASFAGRLLEAAAGSDGVPRLVVIDPREKR